MGKKITNGVNALIIFVDIRGFTSWADKVDNFNFIDAFGDGWYALLADSFDKARHNIKYLGDGAMIIMEINEETTGDFLEKLLIETIDKINVTEKNFSGLCKDFSVKKGSKIPLSLGWGVTKGFIKKVKNDYVGAEINKSSRYCGIAHPFGVVIDAVDFPNLPNGLGIELFKQERKLQGIRDISEVWVSKEISSQFLTRETLKQTPEVHVAGICFKREGDKPYVLLGKRSPTRSLYPGLYEGCGGQLAANETFASGVKRHYRLEYGIEVDVIEKEHLFYNIQVPNEPLIPGVSFLCKYINGEPGSKNHELGWYNREELDRIPEGEFIPGLKKEVQRFLAAFSELRP